MRSLNVNGYIFFAKEKQKKKTTNSKVDDRTHVCNNKLDKGAEPEPAAAASALEITR